MSRYKQLVFDNNFDINSEATITYYKTFEEMKEEYKSFVNSILDENCFYDKNDNYFCSKCLSKLNNNVCEKCNIKYDIKRYLDYNSDYKTSYTNFLIMDVVDDEVLAYIIDVRIKYIEDYIVYKNKNFRINNVLLVKEDGLLDLVSNDFYSFKMFDELNNDNGWELLSNDNYSKIHSFFESSIDYVYFDNFNDLKNSRLYKFINIDELKERLMKEKYNLLYQILCYPVYYKSFEYLSKIGFKSLAYNSPFSVKKGKSFYDSFGVPKKFFKYMKNNDINQSRLNAMRIYPTEDENILDFVEMLIAYFGYSDLKRIVEKYISIPKFYNYYKKNKLTEENLFDYYDYICCAEKLKLNLHDNSILYPKDLIGEHNKLYKQVIITNDQEIDNKIKNISALLQMNKYEDDKYIIFPANSIDDLIDESNQMSNCVKTYCERIANGDCQIYFMRYKTTPNKSLVTVEVKNNKIVQARSKFNKKITEEQKSVLDMFEKRLFPIKII